MFIFVILKQLLSFILLCSLFSCSDSKNEVVDSKLVIPQSNYEVKPQIEEAKQTYQPSIDVELLKKNQLKWDSLEAISDFTKLERFLPISTEKMTYWIDSNQINYHRWTFIDSSKTMNAFLNWMSCYGKDCQVVSIGEPSKMQQKAFVMFQNDTCIIKIELENKGYKHLLNWKKAYTSNNTSWNYIITQKKWDKSTWAKFDEGKEQTIIK